MAVPVGIGMLYIGKTGAVLTDTGSTKTSVECSTAFAGGYSLVAIHPLAGTEQGPGAGFESLFDGRYWIVLPLDISEAVIASLKHL